MQVAFDGIGSMPMARIENYRQVKQEAVEFEMKRRNARKNLDHALIASPEDSHVMQVEGEPWCSLQMPVKFTPVSTVYMPVIEICTLLAGLSGVAEKIRSKYGK